MPRLVIYPYKMGSVASRDLSRSLGVRRVYPDGAFRGGNNRAVINWGNSRVPDWYLEVPPDQMLNPPAAVGTASNKLTFMSHMVEQGLGHLLPGFANNEDDAVRLLESRRNGIVVARTTLQGHSGAGIVLCRTEEEVRAVRGARLYTLHCRHRDEYRVHVFNDAVIDFAMKKRRGDFDGEVNTLVRSYPNGWVFCREDVQLPEAVARAACLAVAGCGLDFGAVDVAHRVGDNEAKVLEVNTAPGLQGTTLERYSSAFSQWYGTLWS